MTSYEPVELRKMMRTRLQLHGRAMGLKNKVMKKMVIGDLKLQNEKIKDFLRSPYHNINPYWKSRALKTIKRAMESLKC